MFPFYAPHPYIPTLPPHSSSATGGANLPDRSGTSSDTNPLGRGLAQAFVNKISDVETYLTLPRTLIHLLCKIPKFMLSAIPRWIGGKIQGGYNHKASGFSPQLRYWTGTVFVGLGNVLGGAIGLVEGATHRIAIGAAERCLRNLVSSSLIMAAGLKKACGSSQESYNATLKMARKIDSPNRTRMSYQKDGRPDRNLMREHQLYASLAERANYDKSDYVPAGLQATLSDFECSALAQNELPESILARGNKDSDRYGTQVKLVAPDGANTFNVYRSDAWSDLGVTFFKREVEGRMQYIINFAAADSVKSNKTIFSTAAGIIDSGFEDANKIVKAFVDKYPGQVVVTGFSKGGAIAQYAGMKNGTKVFAVNSIGISASHLSELGDALVNREDVTLINTQGDWLYDVLPYTTLELVGKQYLIPDSESYDHWHASKALNEVSNQMGDSQDRRSNSSSLGVPTSSFTGFDLDVAESYFKKIRAKQTDGDTNRFISDGRIDENPGHPNNFNSSPQT